MFIIVAIFFVVRPERPVQGRIGGTRVTPVSNTFLKAGRSTAASLALIAGLFVLSTIYTASGGSSRELLSTRCSPT